jgi:hypothetical protein
MPQSVVDRAEVTASRIKHGPYRSANVKAFIVASQFIELKVYVYKFKILVLYNINEYYIECLTTAGQNSTRNQSMKTVSALGVKPPAQMGVATATYRNSPAVTAEPGEFRRRRSHVATAPCITEAGDFEKNAPRVGECMHMGAIDGLALGRRGNLVMALTADNRIETLFMGCRVRIGIGLSGLGIRTKQMQWPVVPQGDGSTVAEMLNK